ncbi:hypothetical protein BO79DRAFT_286787 [Aspergillus costaricaensis CBS 115574]|uniref:Uncharacterized protein n=1 Tax=Aspergillus costaricaensis CBS 115574 TaxID=1448317 RepID=A0ACD1IHQ0_9EURO|nr:hypothetical protein BO79DRAFT_286787 [Aspergillus costaricaensis CBS 115574]RAK89769.1 hypothetical protein BO79DRAFT_286787 [Aspergillus costaricaensis CBS 115574]
MSDTRSSTGASLPDVSPPRHPKRRRARHNKSRKGCYTCKLRRVKCDEVRPVCGACSFRDEPCSFPPPDEHVIPTSTGRARRLASNNVGQPLRPLDLHIPPLSESAEVSHHNESLDMPDMSLLTHFMVHVSDRMALHPERKLIWQRVIPTLATEEEYLMHLLLALAGTHALCEADSPETNSLNPNIDPNIHNNPEANSFRDYYRILDHHQKGLEGFRHALSEATASTAEYIFCGSLLIIAFAFASLRIRALGDKGMGFHNGDSAGEPWIDWLHLVRGLGAFVGEHYAVLRISRLRTIMNYSHANEHWKDFPATSSTPVFPRLQGAPPRFIRFAQGAAQQISLLRAFANTLTQDYGINMEDTPSPDSYGSPNIQTIPELLREQISTIDRLEDMYMRTLYVFRFTASERDSSVSMDIQTDLEDAAVLSWPHLISQSFILSIQQGQDAGIIEGFSYVILAHFYVMLLLFEDLWYLRGTFPREIRNTHMLVVKLGDGALMPLMQWPMAMQEE